MSNVGKLFVDTTTGDERRMYAVGRSGFIDMHNGDYIRYDSAFSDETFDHSAFEEIVVKELAG